jgi:hypothetical protein
MRGVLGLRRFRGGIRVVRIDEQGDHGGVRHKLAQQAQSLRDEDGNENAETRGIAARVVETGRQPVLDRVIADRENDRYRRGQPFRNQRRI